MGNPIDTYDKSKVGSLIAHGWDHLVYEYGEDKVIKFSLLEFLQGKHGRQKKIQDHLTAKIFFGDYILNTEIKSSLNFKKTVIIQPKISGRYLVKKDLENTHVLAQFREIIEADKKMAEEGYGWLDLVGHKGVFRKQFSNIFITSEHKLVIFDVMLVNFKNTGIFYPLFFIGWNLSKWRQRYLIKHFLE